MSKQYYKPIFMISDLEDYEIKPNLKEKMQNELMRCHNIFAHASNSGLTDMLNDEFNKSHPDYFKNNSDKEFDELYEYNGFMYCGYMRYIENEMNRKNISPLLDFSLDPIDYYLEGMLKTNHDVKIKFFMKEVEI